MKQAKKICRKINWHYQSAKKFDENDEYYNL